MLYHAAYASAAAAPQTPDLVADILRASQRNNVRDEISGMLLIANSCYFQILEGPQDKVEACLARLGDDRRHTGVCIAVTGPTDARAFPGWSMGCENLDSLPLARLAASGAVTSGASAFDIHAILKHCDVKTLTANAPVLMALMRAFFRSSGLYRDGDSALDALKLG